MTKPALVNPAYFETRFRLPAPVTDWPPEFVIVTAYATTGERWTSGDNEAAERRLAAELRKLGVWSSVPVSSAAISRVYPATSAARIAASLR